MVCRMERSKYGAGALVLVVTTIATGFSSTSAAAVGQDPALETDTAPGKDSSSDAPPASDSGWEQTPAPDPPPEPRSGLPDAAWEAAQGSNVTLVGADGGTWTGELRGYDSKHVVLVLPNGQIQVIDRSTVAEVRVLRPVDSRASSDTGPHESGRDWAVAGAVTGMALASIGFALAIGAEVTKGETIPALPLGASALAFYVAGLPIINAGGASARRAAKVRGSLGLRVTAWVAYGLTISNGVVLVGLGIADVEPPDGLIATMATLGLASAALGVGDAFISHRQANAERAKASRTSSLRIDAAPSFVQGRARGMTLGVRGSF